MHNTKLTVPILAAILSVAALAPAQAEFFTVDCTSAGPGTPGSGSSPGVAYPTIQAAVDDAAVTGAGRGHTVVVNPCAANPYGNVTISGHVGLHLVAAVVPGDVGAEDAGVGAFHIREAALTSITISDSENIDVVGFYVLDQQNPSAIWIGDQSVNVLIHSNLLSGTGITVDDSRHVDIVSNNTLSAPFDGIALSDCKKCSVVDNVIEYPQGNGVSITGALLDTVVNNKILDPGGLGIVVNSGSGHRLERNTIYEDGVDIRIEAAATSTDVIGNGCGVVIDNLALDTDLAENC